MFKIAVSRCGSLTASFKPPKAAFILEMMKCQEDIEKTAQSLDFKKEINSTLANIILKKHGKK